MYSCHYTIHSTQNSCSTLYTTLKPIEHVLSHRRDNLIQRLAHSSVQVKLSESALNRHKQQLYRVTMSSFYLKARFTYYYYGRNLGLQILAHSFNIE